jgi:TonB family protein
MVPAMAKGHDKPAPAPDLSGKDPHWVLDATSGCWAYAINTDKQKAVSWSGACKNHLLDGRGTLIWTGSGETDTGEFHFGKLNGDGRWEATDGSYVQGHFTDDAPEGAVTIHKSDGTLFIGNFHGGKPNGAGTITYPNGSRYAGNFTNGKFDGAGDLLFSNGNHYVGGFQNGKLDGDGTFTYALGGSYVGHFHEGAFDGSGKLAYRTGASYAGMFHAWRPDGHGIETLTNGATLEADFHAGEPGDEAVYRMPDGTVLKGHVQQPQHDPATPMDKPDYPELALHSGVEGDAIIAVTIGVDGKVKYARLIKSSGNNDLDQSVLSASASWHMIAGSVGGTLVEMEYLKEIHFKLQQ